MYIKNIVAKNNKNPLISTPGNIYSNVIFVMIALTQNKTVKKNKKKDKTLILRCLIFSFIKLKKKTKHKTYMLAPASKYANFAKKLYISK